MAALPLLSVDEIARHNRADDLWLVVDNVVYDLTNFLPHHPGGEAVLLRLAGRDATRVYAAVHGPSLIGAELPLDKHVGRLDEATVTPQWRSAALSADVDEADAGGGKDAATAACRPPLGDIINLADFAAAAENALPAQAWAYIHGGTEDNITRDANAQLLRRVWLRPAVLRGVAAPRMRTAAALFGGAVPLRMPVFVSPTGATRTGGPDGELAIARAAAAAGIVQTISTVASYPYDEILASDTSGQAFFQLYVDRDHRRSEALLARLLGGPHGHKIKAVMVTVDLPVLSKREADERARTRAARARGEDVPPGSRLGLAGQTGAFTDAALSWDDLPWLRRAIDDAASTTTGPPRRIPLVIKGIQRAADARRAFDSGLCDGIVLSNHGGRAADTAPPSILTLLELHRVCPDVFGRLEILIDGGFYRGADVVKAICLGASAVGLGRPFVYAVGYGQAGVEHAANILYDEILTTMRLCGICDLMRDAGPEYVNTGDIDHMVPTQLGHPYAKKRPWTPKL